ncbi:hypothetical protein NUU61_007344 [Penicillium alfredii]|uniref:Extracellular serine-rich protein n=1 Tax=Penicillium alfredii TaxID=1506179 RepID=A0A9W9K480_9EURO|nr:uncharacterized protein NUU61_007344 [Penicillium alfredii]KAJ5092474.1 hypothetical protein NUU61_007344 [Penicillium alfredii]
MLFSRVARPLLLSLALTTLAMAETKDSNKDDKDAKTTDKESKPTTTSVPSSSSATASSTSGAATHTVQVGPKSNPHQYVPHKLTADVGDVIVFEFYPTNHSVVKADYESPCVPASEGVFYSGEFNKFNENNGQLVGPPPTWSLVVNDTKPTFFYCTAIDSCLVNGMVGVINPNSSQTFETQKEKALKYPYMLVPGQSMPAEGSGSTDSGSDSSPSPSASGNAGDSKSSGGGGGLSGGAIAGIAIACVAFVAILIALFFVLGRNRVYRQWMSSQDGRTERTARWALFGSPGDPHQRKSELDSNAAKHEVTSMVSPDPTQRTFSPPPQGPPSDYTGTSPQPNAGHWSWEGSQQARGPRGPTELEAHSVVAEAPPSSRGHQ